MSVRDAAGESALDMAVCLLRRLARDCFLVWVPDLISTQLFHACGYLQERRARCGAKDRNNGERASTFGAIAKILGGSGSTKNLKIKGY